MVRTRDIIRDIITILFVVVACIIMCVDQYRLRKYLAETPVECHELMDKCKLVCYDISHSIDGVEYSYEHRPIPKTKQGWEAVVASGECYYAHLGPTKPRPITIDLTKVSEDTLSVMYTVTDESGLPNPYKKNNNIE